MRSLFSCSDSRAIPNSPSGIFQARVLEWVAIAFSECQHLVSIKYSLNECHCPSEGDAKERLGAGSGVQRPCSLQSRAGQESGMAHPRQEVIGQQETDPGTECSDWPDLMPTTGL